MIALKIIISALIVIAAIYVQINMHFFKAAFARPRTPMRERDRELEFLDSLTIEHRAALALGKASLDEIPCEPVVIKSFDSLTLCGKLYVRSNATKTIILFHSFHSTAQTDFAQIAPFF